MAPVPPSAFLTHPAIALVDAARQTAALRLAHWTLPGWLLAGLCEAAALAYFWSSGGAAAWRDRLSRSLSNVQAVRFCFGALLAAIARLAAFPAAFYLYRVERVMGLSGELTRWWGLSWIAHSLLAMAVAGTIAAVVLWLVDRTHQWYLYTILAIFVVSLSWSLVSPYVESAGARDRTPDAPMTMALHDLAVRSNHPEVAVLIRVSPPLDRGIVVRGIGGARRIVLSQRLSHAPLSEIEYAVAFELAHIVYGDAFSIALIEAAIIVVGAALAVVIADRIGFRRDDDPLSRLALVGALLAIVYILVVPVRNAPLRSYDLRADQYAVQLTGDKAAAVAALVRGTDRRLDEVCPEMLTTIFLSTRPAPGVRIAALNGVPSGCP